MSELSLNNTVSHNVYHTCERCVGKGTYHERRACFDEFIARFEENIAEAGSDGAHQIGVMRIST